MKYTLFSPLVILVLWGLACGDGEPPPLELPTFRWEDWTFELTPEGTINRRYASRNNLEELELLYTRAQEAEGRRRAQHGIEPNIWRVIYALCPETDMVYVDRDGTRYRQVAGMGTEELAWARQSVKQFYDCAYAYSRGNLRIEATDVIMAEPLLGEYRETCFFWPRDWPDLGIGLDTNEYDSVVGHYFPGPTRPWARGGTGGEGDWMSHLGHTSVQFAPGREKGGPLTDLSVITLHEWLHQIAYFPGTKSGYSGLPSQYDAGNLHGGSHLYWMHDVLTPRMWRTVHTQLPTWPPPNKPKDRYKGFVANWLVAGVFDLPTGLATGENMIPARSALDVPFIDEESVLPEAGHPAAGEGGVLWTELKRAWLPEHFRTNLVRLRSAFPSPHRDSIAYAHVYVKSPSRREAILWMTGREPFSAWLNGRPVLKCWGGVKEDEASRRIILMPGWNRLLVKTLDQEARDWWLAARFTDGEHTVLEDLEFSHRKPEGPIVATPDAPEAPSVEIRYYQWKDVKDDWFGLLPILTEQHFEALFGQKGVRLMGPPEIWNRVPLDWFFERRWLLLDVSGLEAIESRVVPPECSLATLENDALLNNLFNLARRTSLHMHTLFYESMAHVRYTRPDGSMGDLVLVRPDLVEPFMNIARYPEGWTGPSHGERIVGFVCRDTKTFVCFDTHLGDPLPVNELDMLRACDGTLVLAAGADVPRVVRGQECKLSCKVLNTGEEPLPCRLVIQEQGFSEPFAREDFELPPGQHKEWAFPLETRTRSPGTATLFCTVTYTREGKPGSVGKPLIVPIFDAVAVKVQVEGSELLITPQQAIAVSLANNLSKPVKGTVAFKVPEGWTIEPPSAPFALQGLDDMQELRFALRISGEAPDGPAWLRAVAFVEAEDVLPAEGGVHVYKRFDPILLCADFEEGIDGDFGIIYQGLYDVELWRRDPAEGRACLKISDRGGQRFGHVCAYGKHTFKPKEIVPYDTEYTYDTRIYPYVDFWFKMEPGSRYDNIGLSIVLDDHENGYGVLINGEWEQQWSPKVMVGRVKGFEADGQWHHVAIDLDEMLDAYLGDTSHYVKELYLGDTRSFSSGWWSSYTRHSHYLDRFQICRSGNAPGSHGDSTPSGLKRYSRTHRVPAFESLPVNGLKATLRFDQLGYLPWEDPMLEVWLANHSTSNIRFATWNRARLWEARIDTEEGGPVTHGWINAWSDPDRMVETDAQGKKVPRAPWERGEPHSREHFQVLKPGESFFESIPLQDLFGHWAGIHGIELERGRSYIVRLRYTNEQSGEEWGEAAWRGSVESNASTLTLLAVPTREEDLVALQSSRDGKRRAKAAAQLGKHAFKPAIPALVHSVVHDRNDDVRLNAACALGEMERFDPENPDPDLDHAVNALIQALADPNWRVAEYAGASLGRIGGSRAVANSHNI